MDGSPTADPSALMFVSSHRHQQHDFRPGHMARPTSDAVQRHHQLSGSSLQNVVIDCSAGAEVTAVVWMLDVPLGSVGTVRSRSSGHGTYFRSQGHRANAHSML